MARTTHALLGIGAFAAGDLQPTSALDFAIAADLIGKHREGFALVTYRRRPDGIGHWAWTRTGCGETTPYQSIPCIPGSLISSEGVS